MRSNHSIPSATVIPVLSYPNVGEAVRWLAAAFDDVERVRIGENHRAQLAVGDGAVIVADTGGDRHPQTRPQLPLSFLRGWPMCKFGGSKLNGTEPRSCSSRPNFRSVSANAPSKIHGDTGGRARKRPTTSHPRSGGETISHTQQPSAFAAVGPRSVRLCRSQHATLSGTGGSSCV
jgi:hypothetical protein